LSRRAIVVAAVCVCAFAAAADAQTAERRVPQLFGRVPSHGDQQLNVSASSMGAYDDDVIAALQSGSVDPRTQKSGTYNELATQVAYAKQGRRLLFGVSESSTLRYTPSLRDLSGMQHVGAIGLSGTLGKTRIRLNQTLGYSPYYSFAPQQSLFELEPGRVPASVSGSVVSRMDARTLGSSADISQPLGQRTTLQLTSSLQDTDFRRDGSGLRSEALGGRVVRNLTRDFGIVLGYGFQQGIYRTSPTDSRITTFHNLDLGIDYHRALSLTRRVAVNVTSGSTLVRGLDGSSQYRVIGDAKVTREIGRSWQAAAAYHRGVDLIDGFGEPFFQDSLIFSAGGTLNSRVSLSVAGGYAKGQLGMANSGAAVNNNDSYNASAHLRVALSRTLAFTSEYSLYRYQFDRATSLPLGLPAQLQRQGFRAGLELWLPLVH